MSGSQSPILFAPDAYDAIAAAMNESERGRWFLEEHARRSRGPDTVSLLDAIGRIEAAVTAQRPIEDVGHLRGGLLEMASAIGRTKAEIAAISAPDQDQSRLGVASEALDGIVRTTERATSDILGAAEEVQEAAWMLRERGVEAEICDRLDRHATQIYTACSFQDLTAQRISRIVNILRYLEDRLAAMIAIWDGEARVPPAPETDPRAAPVPVDLSQSDVDRFIDMQATEPAEAPVLTPITLDTDLDFLPAAPETASADGFEAEPEITEAPEAGIDAVLGAAIDADIDAAIDSRFEAETEAASETRGASVLEPAVEPGFEAGAWINESAGAPEVEALSEPEDEIAAEVWAESFTEELASAEESGVAEVPAASETVIAAASALDEAAPDARSDPAAMQPNAPEPRPAPVRPVEADLDDIDLLSIEEKLALFS